MLCVLSLYDGLISVATNFSCCSESECGGGDDPRRYGTVHLDCQKDKDSSDFYFLRESHDPKCHYVRIMSNVVKCYMQVNDTHISVSDTCNHFRAKEG